MIGWSDEIFGYILNTIIVTVSKASSFNKEPKGGPLCTQKFNHNFRAHSFLS